MAKAKKRTAADRTAADRALEEDIRALQHLRKANKHKAEGGNYLGELRRALEHLETARSLTSYSTRESDKLIRAIRRHIKEAEDEE